MATFYYDDNDGDTRRHVTFDAMKESIVATLMPIKRIITRHAQNKLPVSEGHVKEMVAQIHAIELFLHRLQMMDEPQGRKAVVAPAKRLAKPSP